MRRARPDALLVLADGEQFEGEAIGAPAEVATGEIVFNTVLSGYQEVITDPSYAGQIICFTNPHIGNYGVSAEDDERARPFCRGIVVRDLAGRRSSWRSSEDLDDFLIRHDVAGITGIDTRRLTRHLREAGSLPAAFGTAGPAALTAAAAAEPGTDDLDLVATVTTPVPYLVGDGSPRPFRVVAYDFGIKRAILRQLAQIATVEVVPASTTAAQVMARRPDGVFLSNGPGDPSAVGYASAAIGGLLGEVPIFGICLGHQLLATAIGARTFKLKFGHHGGNHPVRRPDGGVEITSQNHNYAVCADSVAAGSPAAGSVGGDAAVITHVNLNDGVVEGIRVRGAPAFGVQYHPEAGPGPHDARYLFDWFADLMRDGN